MQNKRNSIKYVGLILTLWSNETDRLIIKAHHRQMSTKQIDLIHDPNLVQSLSKLINPNELTLHLFKPQRLPN